MCWSYIVFILVRGISQAARGFCCKSPKGIQICSYAFRTLVSGFHSAALCDPARDTQVCWFSIVFLCLEDILNTTCPLVPSCAVIDCEIRKHAANICKSQACIAGFKKSCLARGGIWGILTGTEWCIGFNQWPFQEPKLKVYVRPM